MAWVRHMNLLKEMEEKAVVREVIYEWFEMEPARKRQNKEKYYLRMFDILPIMQYTIS